MVRTFPPVFFQNNDDRYAAHNIEQYGNTTRSDTIFPIVLFANFRSRHLGKKYFTVISSHIAANWNSIGDNRFHVGRTRKSSFICTLFEHASRAVVFTFVIRHRCTLIKPQTLESNVFVTTLRYNQRFTSCCAEARASCTLLLGHPHHGQTGRSGVQDNSRRTA